MATNDTSRRNSGDVSHIQAIANQSIEKFDENTKQIDKDREHTDTEISENESTLHVNAEFLEVLISSYDMNNSKHDTVLSRKLQKKMKAIIKRMNGLFHDVNNSKNTNFNNIVALAQSYLHIFCISSKNENGTMRLYLSKNYLLKSLELLQDNVLDQKAILIVLRVLYEFACICNTSDDPQRSELFLYKAYQIYLTYRNKKDYLTPINIINIANIKGIEDHTFYLDNLQEKILNALICLHSSKSGHINKQKTIIYVYEMLSNKLNQIILKYEDYIDWIVSSTKLSEYLIIYGCFTEARHHLAVATMLLWNFWYEISICFTQKKYSNPKEFDSSYNLQLIQKKYWYGRDILDRCWVKYGIELLHSSYDKLLYNNGFDKYCKTDILESESVTSFKEQYTKLIFPNLKSLRVYKYLITDKYVTTYDEANNISNQIILWLIKAQEFYNRIQYFQEYFKIGQDVSKVYKYLAGFEKDRYKQIKLHKCRVQTLQIIVNNLNQKHTFEKQIIIELAIAHFTILKIYVESFSELGPEFSFFELHKIDSGIDINNLVKTIMSYYRLYIYLID